MLLPAPSLSFLDSDALWSLLPSVVAVAALAALESLRFPTVADGMSVNQRHDPDRELFGQGIANVITPMFGGVPATAAIAATAVNVRSDAASPPRCGWSRSARSSPESRASSWRERRHCEP